MTDPAGNITTYTYDSHDKLLSASASVSGSTAYKQYLYDSNGNCTQTKVGPNASSLTTTATLSYDVENRVTGISYPSTTSSSFHYNGLNLRTSKTDSSGTKNYVTDGVTPGSDVLKDGAATYTPGISESRGTGTPVSKYYHGDALGSNGAITGSSQSVTDTAQYDAFGNITTFTPSSGGTPTPFQYVGAQQYQKDGDSGLSLVGNRYYDSDSGRFISQDPAQAGDNQYAYCGNNPLGSTDPSGLDAQASGFGTPMRANLGDGGNGAPKTGSQYDPTPKPGKDAPPAPSKPDVPKPGTDQQGVGGNKGTIDGPPYTAPAGMHWIKARGGWLLNPNSPGIPDTPPADGGTQNGQAGKGSDGLDLPKGFPGTPTNPLGPYKSGSTEGTISRGKNGLPDGAKVKIRIGKFILIIQGNPSRFGGGIGGEF